MGGPENGNFPFTLCSENVLKYVGGWVVQKSLKKPLRNIKMAPYCNLKCSVKRFEEKENVYKWIICMEHIFLKGKEGYA